MQQFAQQISAASQAEDWDELERLDALVHAALPGLAAQGPLTPAERSALAVLREQHGQAVLRCQGAAAGIAAQMRELQDNKEGRAAYALESLLVELGN